VHELFSRAKSDGGEFNVGGAPYPAHRAIPKMFMPILVILPGMIAVALTIRAA